MGGMVPPMSLFRAPVLLTLLVLPLAACGDWPDPGDPAGVAVAGAPAPRLAPLPDLLAAADPDTEALAAEGRTLRARAAGLRARAAQVTAQP
jgi:hypothetical protein